MGRGACRQEGCVSRGALLYIIVERVWFVSPIYGRTVLCYGGMSGMIRICLRFLTSG